VIGDVERLQTENLRGRRLPDAVFGEPGPGWDAWKDSQPGDYMKVDHDGKPWWYIRDPWGRVGRLTTHTIQEHEDGTITVAPSIYDKDGGSLTQEEIVQLRERYPDIPTIAPGLGNDGWHGWLERGIWRSA
jgi:hypothetical protein